MATGRGVRTDLTRCAGRLGAVVAGAIGRIAGSRTTDEETPSRTATRRDGDRTGCRKDRGTEQFVTPEERIVEVIERAGGSTKQAEIVATVQWSESTVSRKLSDLEDLEAVSRFQVGREKVVYLPGSEPAAVRSPLATAD